MRSGRAVIAAVVGVLALLAAACVPAPPINVSSSVGNLRFPWDLRWTPANADPPRAMVYSERPVGVSIVANGQKILDWQPADVLAQSESGVMGIELSPGFAANRRLFVCMASTQGPDVRVVRLTLGPGLTTVTNRTDIVTGIPINPFALGTHAGCRIRFGPDWALWVGTGDAKIGTVPQDPTSLGGKILRVDEDGNPAPGNAGWPFDPRIHSWGHRNVQGIAFRGNQAFAVEHGTGCDDEVNRLVVGNYGWDPVPRVPGGPSYDESTPMTDLQRFPNAIRPSWSSGCPTIAPSGGEFVHGPWWGEWDGGLVLGVLKGSKLFMVRLSPDGWHTQAISAGLTDRGRLRTPVIGPDAALYVTTSHGNNTDEILRVTPDVARAAG